MTDEERRRRKEDPDCRAIEITSMPEEEQPYVFVSYRSDDWETVLKKAVFILQKCYGLRVYYDASFDDHNELWLSQMRENMEHPDCRCLLAFASERYLTSYATLLELMYSQTNVAAEGGPYADRDLPTLPVVIVQVNDLRIPSGREGQKGTGLGEPVVGGVANINYAAEKKTFDETYGYLKAAGVIDQVVSNYYKPEDEGARLSYSRCARIMQHVLSTLGVNNNFIGNFDNPDDYAGVVNTLQNVVPEVFGEIGWKYFQRIKSFRFEGRSYSVPDPEQAYISIIELARGKYPDLDLSAIESRGQSSYAVVGGMKLPLSEDYGKLLSSIPQIRDEFCIYGITLPDAQPVRVHPVIRSGEEPKAPAGSNSDAGMAGAASQTDPASGSGAASHTGSDYASRTDIPVSPIIPRSGEYTYRWSDGRVYTGTWKDGKRHGYGRMVYASGQIYEGPWVRDKREGRNGRFIWQSGSEYYGDWKHDERHGHGVMKNAVKDSPGQFNFYDGPWVNGFMEGEGGRYTWASGSEYYGDWKHDERHGHGVMKVALKSSPGKFNVYDGPWVNGREEGDDGHLQWADGSVYDGSFKADKYHGHGVLRYASGNVYDGEFAEGIRQGHGRMTYSNGHIYDGPWVNGIREGADGRYTWPSGSEYIGDWKADKRHGHGVQRTALTDQPGQFNVYDGPWVEGRQEGENAQMRWATGDVYVGDYKDGKYHGYGLLLYADGSAYEGHWEEGRKNGEGITFNEDGTIREQGIYADGRLIKPEEVTRPGSASPVSSGKTASNSASPASSGKTASNSASSVSSGKTASNSASPASSGQTNSYTNTAAASGQKYSNRLPSGSSGNVPASSAQPDRGREAQERVLLDGLNAVLDRCEKAGYSIRVRRDMDELIRQIRKIDWGHPLLTQSRGMRQKLQIRLRKASRQIRNEALRSGDSSMYPLAREIEEAADKLGESMEEYM